MNVKAAENTGMSKAVKTNRISDFFVKQRDPPAPYKAPSAPLFLAPNTPTFLRAGPSRLVSSTDNTDMTDVEAVSRSRQHNQTGTSGMTSTRAHPLVARLRSVSAHLPESVPVGQDSDPFAVFSGDPRNSIVAGDDPWESIVDPCLNRVIGYGVSTDQIAATIRRGPFGIEGFCRWIEICMVELKIAPELLEMKLERVFDALNLLYVPFLAFIIVNPFSHAR
jgi:hypothetical protein